jgi:hypothetical protein
VDAHAEVGSDALADVAVDAPAGDSNDVGTDAGCSNAVVTDVLTYHNDNARTGQYLAEECLATSTVNSSTFGKLFVLPADGKVDAQPLYVHGVSVAGKGVHNVVVVATESDTLYAYDADSNAGANAQPLWRISLLGTGETPSDDRGCGQVSPTIGITSTPVIDPTSGTIYAVAMSKDASSRYHQRLHAIDLASGAERAGSPVEIQARYPGTGDNSTGGFVVFDPRQYKARPGLLLMNGEVYTAWSSHCDIRPYTGWIIAYSASTFQQTRVIDVVPNGSEASIWMSGGGLATDGSGGIYFLTANGTFETTLDANGFPSGGDFGNAFVKLQAGGSGLSVADYFTMRSTVSESNADTDLGSGGAMVLPDAVGSGAHPHLLVGAGKDGALYLVDRDNMGHYNPLQDDIVQEIPGALSGGVWAVPAYYDGAIYYGPNGNHLLRFAISNATLSASPTSMSQAGFGYPGTFPSISASSASSASAIVWAVEASTSLSNAVLHAYQASDLSVEVYNSNQAPNERDHFGAGNKFIVPTIANSKVYVGTTNGVGVFGHL